MRFYVATSLANASTAREVCDLMQRRGHTITFDWMAAPPLSPRDPRWPPSSVVSPNPLPSLDASSKDIARRAYDDAEGVLKADMVIVILPGGIGTHTELGLALGRFSTPNPARVVLWDSDGEIAKNDLGQGYPCVFHKHPFLRVVEGSMARLMVEIENYWDEAAGDLPADLAQRGSP